MTICAIECTSIPDGFAAADKSLLRLSLILRPATPSSDPTQPATGPSIDLKQWPTELPGLQFQIWAGPSKADLKPVDIIAAANAFEDEHTAAITPHAQLWWNKLWTNEVDLLHYLDLLNGGGSTIDTDPKSEVTGYDYAMLHEQAIVRSAEEFVRASSAFEARRLSKERDTDAAEARRLGKSLEAEFSGLTLRAARDPNDPMVRIARLLYREDPASVRSAEPPGFFGRLLGTSDLAAAGLGEEVTLAPDFAKALNPNAPFTLFMSDDAAITPNEIAEAAARVAQNDADFEESMKTDEELGAKPDAIADELFHAYQVLGALQAHPALRKFARQLADLSLDSAKLRAALGTAGEDASAELKGVVAVELLAAGAPARSAPSQTALFTAFVLRTGRHALFEPCPIADFPSPTPLGKAASATLRDGFVLPETLKDDVRRYQIASIDSIASYYASKRSDGATLEAYRSGANFADAPTEPTGFRTRGLMLLDMGVKATAEAAEAQQDIIESNRLFFAEDLVDGYRVDVVAPNGAVYPGCARSLDYHAFDTLSADLKKVYVSYRSDGYVAPLARTWTVPTSDPKMAKRVLSVSQVMVTWTGRQLGLQPGEEAEMSVPGDEEKREIDPLRARYAFDRARIGPILRQFGHYRFMLRARKINGSSVPLSAERVGEFALGSQDDKIGSGFRDANAADPGYEFGLIEKAPAPTLLVEDGFPRGHGVDPADRETISSIFVVAGAKDAKIRWLTSPISGFDLAELQGQFDPASTSAAHRKTAERKADYGAYRYLKHTDEGFFPNVKIGEDSIAQAFLPIPPSQELVDAPHFIDATLRTVSARLVATKATPAQALSATSLATDPAFFPEALGPADVEPDDVVPIRLEIRALEPGEPTNIRLAQRSFPLKIPGAGGRTLNVPTICIDVAEADTVKLELWSNRTIAAVYANPAIARVVAAANAKGLAIHSLLDPKSDKSRKLFGDFVREQRTSALSDVTTLRIEYPVEKPLEKPREIDAIKAYRAVDKAKWTESIAKEGGSDTADAAKIFSGGRILIDRKSTGEVWAEAFWVDTASKNRVFRTTKPEDPARVEQTGLYRRETPILSRRLFTLPPLELPLQGADETDAAYLRRINEIDLLLDDKVQPNANGSPSVRVARALGADFDCDRHRTLAVRLVARSRFAPSQSATAANTPAGSASAGGQSAGSEVAADLPEDMTYLEESASREACRAALGSNMPAANVIKVVMLATRRPPPPRLTRDKGTLYQRELRTSADGRETSLVHIYRCWLDGDWFASGDGEKLAVVCRQPRAASLPGWADAQVSRWGGDTASVPGQKLRVATELPEEDSTYLLAEQIGGATKAEATLVLARKTGEPEGAEPSIFGDPSDPEAEVAKVDLACLEPKFHDGYGRWYCDIEFKPTGAFKAALKLVLARYQEHALSGRQLSQTIAVDAVMLPQPWRFSVRRSGSAVSVVVTGPAYQGRAPMLDKMPGIKADTSFPIISELIGETRDIPMETLPHTPLIFAELERLDSKGKGPMPVLSGGHAVVQTNLGVQPQTVPEEIADMSGKLMLKRWTLDLNIPAEDVGKPLAVRVSLASAHANSQARNRGLGGGVGRDGAGFQPSALDGELIFLPEPIVVQLKVPAK